MNHFVNEQRCHKPCESLNGAWETRTHSRARGGCHVSTSPGRGVTLIPRPSARKGPIIPFHSKKLENNRMFWQQYLIGTLLDFRRFSVETIKRLINRAWRLRESISIAERKGNNYSSISIIWMIVGLSC